MKFLHRNCIVVAIVVRKMPLDTVNVVNHICSITMMRPPLKVLLVRTILIFAFLEDVFHSIVIFPFPNKSMLAKYPTLYSRELAVGKWGSQQKVRAPPTKDNQSYDNANVAYYYLTFCIIDLENYDDAVTTASRR